MTSTVPNYRWSTSEFVRAWEAGAFDQRVELIEGEVWPVGLGRWHGRLVADVIAMLKQFGHEVTASTLPSGSSLPDPDCWVLKSDASPSGVIGQRIDVWRPDDVLLVVEVSDETMLADLMTKAKIYGSAGWPVYWVVTQEAVYEHTEPTDGGYRLRREYRRGERVTVRYADTDLAVDDLLGPLESSPPRSRSGQGAFGPRSRRVPTAATRTR